MPSATQRGHLGRVAKCGVHGQDEIHLPAQLIIATCCNLGHQVLWCEVEELRRRRDHSAFVGLWGLAGKLVQQLWQVVFLGRCCPYILPDICAVAHAQNTIMQFRAALLEPEGVIRANSQSRQPDLVDGKLVGGGFCKKKAVLLA